MYPFKDGLIYPRNQWYVGAWSSELAAGPVQRSLLEEPIVFFRGKDGAAAALAAQCPHRRYPLALGTVHGNALTCGYHGWTFDRTGACVRIPSQEHVPAGFRVRAYPTVERWEWLWIWMGDPDLANPSLIPDHAAVHLEDPAWHAEVGGLEPMRARWCLMVENVLDLTHIPFVHSATIGTPTIASAPITLSERAGTLRSERLVAHESPTPFHRGTLGLPDRVDRVLVTDFHPPTVLASGSRFFADGAGSGEEPPQFGEFRVFHIATPETATTSHYFWAFTRTFAHDDAALTNRLRTGFHAGVLEDVAAMEANERMIATGPDQQDLSSKSDAGSLRGRHMLEAIMLAEHS